MYDRTAVWLNGVELSNAWRVYAYLQGARSRAEWDGDCEPWIEWGDACWQDKGTYTTPANDPAPWWSSREPESSEFMGFWLQSMVGLDEPTETRTLAQRITSGSATSRLGTPGRTVTVTGTLYATTERGMEFGQRWLMSVLNTPDECAAAKGTLVFRAACPPHVAGADPMSLLRYLVNVSMQKAPKYSSVHGDSDSTCDRWFQDVEFTLASETADVFGYPLAGVGFTNQPLIYGTRQACSAAIACCDPLRDLGRNRWRSAYYRAMTGVGAVPVITIATTTGTPLNRFRIAVFADATGSACVDQQPMANVYQCANPVTEFEVTGMPTASSLVLSGIDGAATFYPAGGGVAVDGTPYVNPLTGRGVAGLADTRGPVCVLGAVTSAGSAANNGGVWSVQFQPRYRQG